MIDQEKLKNLIVKIELHKSEIAKHRDELRNIVDDLEAIVETARYAEDHLTCAIEELSQYL